MVNQNEYDAMSSIVKAVAAILVDHNATCGADETFRKERSVVSELIERAVKFEEDKYSDSLRLKDWLHDVAGILPRLWL